mgnify:CR=1 FL=1
MRNNFGLKAGDRVSQDDEGAFPGGSHDGTFRDDYEYTGAGDGHLEHTYPDFVSIAQGYGVASAQVRTRSEFSDALATMLASDGPYLLDCICPYQEHVLPMIPTGHSVRDIITE